MVDDELCTVCFKSFPHILQHYYSSHPRSLSSPTSYRPPRPLCVWPKPLVPYRDHAPEGWYNGSCAVIGATLLDPYHPCRGDRTDMHDSIIDNPRGSRSPSLDGAQLTASMTTLQ